MDAEGTHVNFIKPLCDKRTANVILRSSRRVPTVTPAVWHSPQSPRSSNQAGQRNDRHPDGKEEVKVSLFVKERKREGWKEGGDRQTGILLTV